MATVMEGLEKHSQGTWEKDTQKFDFTVELGHMESPCGDHVLPQSMLAEHTYESEGS